MDASELLKRYAEGERDFSEVVLERVKLFGTSVIGANLNQANLNRATLIGIGLAKTIFRGANLS
ncbi:MAG TPA: hypothetical protein DCE56_21875, partial [Cyanobacteria bacterium UBA8553]|nr:hypothetical protein [Cyanobacteria bacterium UBA8553]